MSSIRIGVGQVDYAPALGLPFMGHIRKDYASKGVHDPLHCKAVVFEDEQGNRAALASMDVCMLDRRQVAFFRQCVGEKTDIPAEHILLAATHTHGGPATVALYECPVGPQDEIEAFLSRAAQAVVKAALDLRPASIRIGRARESRVCFNRRLRLNDGSTVMNWTQPDPGTVAGPLGLLDDELIVLVIEAKGRPVGALVNFALHPAIIDYENSLYTADYPGYLAQALEQINGDGFVSVFFNGCCGNLNHIDYSDKDSPRRGFVMSQRVGYMLAAAAAQAIRHSVQIKASPVKVFSEKVGLNRLPISRRQYEWAQKVLTDTDAAEYTQGNGLDPRTSAALLIRMHEQQNEPDQVEVMTIRIGEFAVVGLPGEVFTELGLQIKQESPAVNTVVIEMANDAVGYLPAAEAFEQGGYEVTPGATAYEKGSAEKLVSAALRQLDSLFK